MMMMTNNAMLLVEGVVPRDVAAVVKSCTSDIVTVHFLQNDPEKPRFSQNDKRLLMTYFI